MSVEAGPSSRTMLFFGVGALVIIVAAILVVTLLLAGRQRATAYCDDEDIQRWRDQRHVDAVELCSLTAACRLELWDVRRYQDASERLQSCEAKGNET
jgi:hypothetical protein